jgi:hypothetical protein
MGFLMKSMNHITSNLRTNFGNFNIIKSIDIGACTHISHLLLFRFLWIKDVFKIVIS